MAIKQTKLLSMLGIGDAGRDINRVLPEYTAMVTDIAIGYEAGIAANYGNKFDYRMIEGGLVIQSGACWAYGYAGYNRNDVKVPLQNSGGSARYVFIFLEFDLSGAGVDGTTVDAFKLIVFDNGNNASLLYQQDNLRQSKSGKYQIPLYRVAVSASGITTDDIQDLRVIRTSVKHADEATNSENTIKAVMSGAIIKSGVTIESGVMAEKQAKGNRSANIATTSYVMEAIDDVKNISSGTIAILSGSSAENYIKRQVNFVYAVLGYTTPTHTNNLTKIATVPDGYRPKTAIKIFDGTIAGYDNSIFVNTDGTIYLTRGLNMSGSTSLYLQFGYEITG